MRFIEKLINLKRILGLKILLFSVQFYFSCWAPIPGAVDAIAAATAILCLFDTKKSFIVRQGNTRQSSYELYLQDLCKNIDNPQEIRRCTLLFMSTLQAEQGPDKLCSFYKIKSGEEFKLTTVQILIFIFCFCEMPGDLSDRFKLNFLIPFRVDSAQARREFAEISTHYPKSFIDSLIEKIGAIPIRRTPDRPDSCRPGASPASSSPSGTPPAYSSYLSSPPTRR